MQSAQNGLHSSPNKFNLRLLDGCIGRIWCLVAKSIPKPSFLDRMQALGAINGERRWRSLDGKRLYTWDALHGEIEVFNTRGKHLGALDPLTGRFVKTQCEEERSMSEERSKTFIDLCLSDEVFMNEIDNFVDAWHDGASKASLRKCLGMSEQEYARWIVDPGELSRIIASRKIAAI